MRALHAAFLCGVAFLVGRQSTLAPVESYVKCSRPTARRLLMFNGGKHHGKGRGGKGRGGKGRGENHRYEKTTRLPRLEGLLKPYSQPRD